MITPSLKKIYNKSEIPLTIVTLVRNPEIYKENVIESTSKYKNKIEYITLYHNSSASNSLNTGVVMASNDIILTCHQDIYFKEGWYESLKKQLDNLRSIKNNWGVCGFAGATAEGKSVGTHSGLGMENKEIIPVQTLDGSILILQKHNNLIFDEKLKHFHMYDIDVCLQSHEKNLGVYCINVPIEHRCKWTAGEGFQESAIYTKNKWQYKVGLINSTLGCINYMV